jgi:hypothetical protein
MPNESCTILEGGECGIVFADNGVHQRLDGVNARYVPIPRIGPRTAHGWEANQKSCQKQKQGWPHPNSLFKMVFNHDCSRHGAGFRCCGSKRGAGTPLRGSGPYCPPFSKPGQAMGKRRFAPITHGAKLNPP